MVRDNGAKWKGLLARFGSKSSVHRWLKRRFEQGVVKIKRLTRMAFPWQGRATWLAPHESALAQGLFEFMACGRQAESVVGDNGCDETSWPWALR